jgi:MFS family permease
VLGGWLTDAVSWRAVFLINVPVAALAVWLVMVGAKESKGARAGPVDWLGAAAITVSLALVTWALTDAPKRGFADPRILATLIAGLAGLVAFPFIERKAKSPMTPLDLFRSIRFSGLNGYTLLLYGAFGGALFLLPFLLIRAHGFDPAAAGAALLPLSVGLAVLSPISGRLQNRIGARTMLVAGPAIVAAGFGLMAWRADSPGYWTGPFAGLVLLAFGLGLAVAPLTDAVLGAVPGEYEGAASGINNAVARVAGLLAVALVGFILGGSGGGPEIVAGFRTALIAAAAVALGASAIALLTVGPARREAS